jgi:hypothetical protein
MENTYVQIAQTVLIQLNILTEVLFVWVQSNLLHFQNANIQGGVRFKVKGFTFKGRVKVELT